MIYGLHRISASDFGSNLRDIISCNPCNMRIQIDFFFFEHGERGDFSYAEGSNEARQLRNSVTAISANSSDRVQIPRRGAGLDSDRHSSRCATGLRVHSPAADSPPSSGRPDNNRVLARAHANSIRVLFRTSNYSNVTRDR